MVVVTYPHQNLSCLQLLHTQPRSLCSYMKVGVRLLRKEIKLSNLRMYQNKYDKIALFPNGVISVTYSTCQWIGKVQGTLSFSKFCASLS